MITAKCDKCGKVLTVTEREARHLEGVLVCPQCLNTLKVDLSLLPPEPPPGGVEAHERRLCPSCGVGIGDNDRFCPHCGEQVNKPKRVTASPPPYIKPATPPAKAAPPKIYPSTITPQHHSPKTTKMSKNNNKKNNDARRKPLSALGCLGLSVLIVVVFFAVYFFLGY